MLKVSSTGAGTSFVLLITGVVLGPQWVLTKYLRKNDGINDITVFLELKVSRGCASVLLGSQLKRKHESPKRSQVSPHCPPSSGLGGKLLWGLGCAQGLGLSVLGRRTHSAPGLFFSL